MKTLILLVTALAASATAALAQAPQPVQPARPEQYSAPGAGPNGALDMNQMICRTQSVVGSRLTHNRVCVSRQQWLEQQRMDRLYTEKAQTNRIWPGQ
jgi:opacity protein-like surface antigen